MSPHHTHKKQPQFFKIMSHRFHRHIFQCFLGAIGSNFGKHF